MEYEIGENELVSTAVILSVSIVEDCEPFDLPPLTNTVDPDALDMLFESCDAAEPKSGGRISFPYSKSRVAIENGEYLTVNPILDIQMEKSRPHGSSEP